MSKFLLLLCFTAVHVLGEGQENVSSGNVDVRTTVAPLHDSEHFEANTLSNKIVSVEPMSVSLDTDKNKLKAEESLTNQSSVQRSVVAPNQFTVAPPDATTILIHTNELNTEHVSHAATNSTVVRTPMGSKMHSDTSGKWIVTNGTEICIMVEMSVGFNISYITVNNETHFKIFDVPTDNTTAVSGHCGEMEQNLTLKWSSKNVINASMTLHFIKNATTKDYSFHHLEVILPPANFPNTTLNESEILVHEPSNIVVGLSNSYRCLKQQTLSLKEQTLSLEGNGTTKVSGYLTVSNVQFEAFKTGNSTTFGLAKDCAFYTSDVVPIAVGCALAGLVFIVLIAYLVGRRNQTQGYLSM